MANDRFVSAEYCDDVRQEVGNKISLIGCYGTDMIVGALPAFLPKLCVVVKLRTPVDQPFGVGTIRLLRDDQSIAEMPVDATVAGVSGRPENATWQFLQAVIALSPFPIEAPCFLRVELEAEGEVILGPKLRIRASLPPVSTT